MNDIESFSAGAAARPNGATATKDVNAPGDPMFFESAILPAQFYPRRRNNAEMESERRRLAFAVLTDAIRCFQLNMETASRSKMPEFAEAESWIFAPTDDGPFSFENVCFLLEIHPGDVRRGLRQWQAMKAAGFWAPSRLRRSPINRSKALYQRHFSRRAG
jgi:hypothetical protein